MKTIQFVFLGSGPYCSLPSLRAVNSISNVVKSFPEIVAAHFFQKFNSCSHLSWRFYLRNIKVFCLNEKDLNILEDYYLRKMENYKTAISCDVGNIQINESHKI